MPRGNRIYSMSTGTFSLYVLFCYVDVIFFNKNQFYLCERNTFTQNYVIMWVNYLTSLSLSISFQQSLMRFQWVNKSKVLDRKLGNRAKAQEMLNVTHRSCSLSLLWWSWYSSTLSLILERITTHGSCLIGDFWVNEYTISQTQIELLCRDGVCQVFYLWKFLR